MDETKYYEPLTYLVTSDEAGWTVRDVLQRRMGMSRKLLSKLKLSDGVLLNDAPVHVNVPVAAGDRLIARMAEEESDDILPQAIPIVILYEDEDLLALDKPAGRIVHPTHGHYTDTVANGVVYYWLEKGERHRFRPVHRLDQETSGVLLIAKNKYAHHQLSEQLIRHETKKVYSAIVWGRLNPAKGTINAPIDRSEEDRKIRVVTPSGYPAITHYEAVEEYRDASLVRIRLQTGRTHQIRVHMKYLGHPLIGDRMYGNGIDAGIGRHALHAASLGFHHPRTREWLELYSPLPADMESLKLELTNDTIR